MKKKITLSIVLLSTLAFAADDDVKLLERTGWTFSDTNTTYTAEPTNMKFFKFYDEMPDEISLEAFKDKDLTGFENKKLFVGYGVAEATGNNCKLYPPAVTGKPLPITICLPWWRIERVYQKEWKNVNDLRNFFKTLPKPRPPITVSYCKTWAEGKTYQGGVVTCTEYYDKFISQDCYDNPKQGKCFVNNCSEELTKRCVYNGYSLGEKETLDWAEEDTVTKEVSQVTNRIELKTKQYVCPAGKIIPYTSCLEETNAMMYSYMCKEDDPSTIVDDGVYVYCDKDKPTYDASGNIIGFLGNCPDGRNIICDVNTLKETKRKCEDPITEIESEYVDKTTTAQRNYKEFEVDVVSGQTDIYAADPNCLRANTIQEARAGVFTARIIGNGSLDDDIFVLTHSEGGDITKVYCNQQHNEYGGSRKVVGGKTLQCIDNNGNYKFDKTVGINAMDIVSVQQATENENGGASPMSSRTHYRSTDVTIDGVLVAPSAYTSNFPHYPRNGSYLKLFENSLGTLSLLFPFSGAYKLYFYDQSGLLMADAVINGEDFEAMGDRGNKRLLLGNSMKVVVSGNTCKTDHFANWGGGVYGGKNSLTGSSCATPNDTYEKNHKVWYILVKDLLTGAVTKVDLVYPLAYPNRVFVSKLKLREKRKYRCYDAFPVVTPK